MKSIALLFLLLLPSPAPLFSKDDPYKDAQTVWHFKDLTDAHNRVPLTNQGVKIGLPLQTTDARASLASDSDGHYAAFDGSAWLTFKEREPLFNSREGTLLVRFFPEKSGGIITTSSLSVVIHESGLLIVVVSLKDARGTLFRELPFGFVKMNTWHNLVVHYKDGYLSVEMNGIRQGEVALLGELEPIPIGSAFIGKWKLEKMPLPGFPRHIVDMLFQKTFTGKIDHMAIWKRALRDNERTALSGVEMIADAPPSAYADCLIAYRDFYSASRRMDIEATERLGLVMRKFMAQDKRRPTYHLTAPMDAILDPAGATYYNGQYHVYSYRNMVSLLATTPLAHFVSNDLVHWKDYPIGVWADSRHDVFGIWLANIFKADDGKPAMIYTGLGTTGKYGILARSDNDLLSFDDKKPVLTNMVHHDGHTWKEGDMWYTLTTKQYWGSRPGDLGDAILLLSSTDLIHWTDHGEIFSVKKHSKPADDSQQQGFTEYPYLLRFGDKHVLMTGTRPSVYWIGTFDKSIPAFVPDHPQGRLLDHLNTFHCFNPMTVDNKGPGGSDRRIIEAMHLYASGNVEGVPWYGVHTLPRVISLLGNRLYQEPVPEAAALRRNHQKKSINISSASPVASGLSGNEAELIVEFDVRESKKTGVLIYADKGGNNGVRIYYDGINGKFGVDGNIKRPANYPELGEVSVVPPPNEKIKLRVLIDHNFFEVFVDGETFTGVFNGNPEQQEIFLFSEGGKATVSVLDFWEMDAAWDLR